MTEINLLELKRASWEEDTLTDYLNAYMATCSPDDPPELSDLIVGYRAGGVLLLKELEGIFNEHNPNPFKWHIPVIRDEWGNPPSPGDDVIRRIQKPLERPRKDPNIRVPVSSDEINIDIANGEYDKKWIREVHYTVDEKGCITCEFSDAMFFLTRFGVHYKKGHKLCKHINPHSEEPVDCPNGGKLHIWYHRFKEAPKHIYDKLPKIPKRKGPRRGIDDLDVIRAWDDKQKRMAEEKARDDNYPKTEVAQRKQAEQDQKKAANA